MKIIFIPDYNKGNPYQKALADSLSKEGVSVNFGTARRLFPVLTSCRNYWKPDILHIHWQHPFLLASSGVKTILKSTSFIAELLILKLLGVKIVWTVHNLVSHESNFSLLETFFTKLLTKLCNKIIVHCPFAKSKVMNKYRARESQIAVIPHGNYISWYKNVITKSQARGRLNLSNNDVVFLYFGQIRPYKGTSELIEAFKKLGCQQTKLLIVGKPLNDEVAKDMLNRCKGNENIETIFEFIPNDEIQIYMNAVDVIVLPYKDILTSGAVILAMSFGKPVIVPAIGCIPDVLDIEGSILYNSSEKEGLLKAMQCALDVDLQKIGKHNFELAKKLRWDKIAKRTYGAYRECLRSKRRE
ncbi:MAG: glycosyltransferase family 4 protein [Candidatus Helarchaeota archaeon]